MIKIEFEEPILSRCDCCGETTTQLTRFVYKNDDAFAVYYASFTENHGDKVVWGLIGLGEWGEGSEPKDRFAFPFRLWTDANNNLVSLTDKAESPWKEVDFLGSILDREAALTHPMIQDVFHITDHIVTDDQVVVAFLAT
jgi:hypothetical protein